MPKFDLVWDLEDDLDGNVAHIAEHGLTIDEIEEVLYSKNFAIHVNSLDSGEPGTYGHTSTGIHILVIWAVVNDDPALVRIVTAFETPERRRR